jgi:tyrosine-protein phosphatase YwqE
LFSIFKKKFHGPPADFSRIGTDVHSHLLPGIDDGSPDLTVSLQLKKGLEELGFRNFITTPHIMWDMYKNTAETIGAALQIVTAERGQNNIRAAAEYYMDDYFDGLLAGNQRLLTLSGNKVLVEFSFVSLSIHIKETLFTLGVKGYQPVLAHPERYQYFTADKSIYDEFRNMGCLFQVNILSFAGYYGKISRDLANWLVSKKYVDFLGTDLHHFRHLEALRNSPMLMPAIQQISDAGTLQNLSL